MSQDLKQRLIHLIGEKIAELDCEAALNTLDLDIYQVVDEAIEAKLKNMTESELVDILAKL